ncbi:MAG: hypothetical protein HQK62_14770 [Desulfamplus sp.]|nr:hypothetical protein [Desulfamplus sp.]
MRLEDIEGLEREKVYYKKQKEPRKSAIKAGASKKEAEILVQNYDYNKAQWWGERVELNALTAPQLIAFIENKFEEHGVKKVVPEKKVLEKYYKAKHKANMVDNIVDALNQLFNPYIRKIEKEVAQIQKDIEIEAPQDLQEMVMERIEGTTINWTYAIANIANSKNADAVTQKRIEAMINPILEEIKEKFEA